MKIYSKNIFLTKLEAAGILSDLGESRATRLSCEWRYKGLLAMREMLFAFCSTSRFQNSAYSFMGTIYGCEVLGRRTNECLILQRRGAIRGINSAANLPDLPRPVAIPAPCLSRTLVGRLRESCLLLRETDINNQRMLYPVPVACTI